MNILLILPAADNLRINSKSAQVPKRKMLRFSLLPLTSLAALTPEKHQVRIIDENVEALDFDADVDLVGVSFMTALAPRAYKIASEFKKRGKITVAGGYHPTLMPEEATKHFDVTVIGDAEGLWEQVLLDAENNTYKSLYSHQQLPDLKQTPVPTRRLMSKNAKHYATVNAVQVGRGCQHRCRYCSVTAFHQATYRSRPLESVIKELQGIEQLFIFVDDNIIGDRDYTEKLFRAMIPMKKRWVSQCSIEIADDPELLKLAYRAGCRGLFIGLETISGKNLEQVEKGFNDSRGYKERIRRIHRQGISIIAGMIVGLDNDDVHVFQRTLRFLEKTGIDALQLNILTPLPGTPLFEEYKQKGRITDYDWNKYDFRHVVIEPARMNREELQDGADWLYNEFYRLPRIIRRSLRNWLTRGLMNGALTWKLNMTYRYDNIREKIIGKNPAKSKRFSQLPSYSLRGIKKAVLNSQ
jgi:radical SAM superfamily enzyme YgiQ (UPF0313 family)